VLRNSWARSPTWCGRRRRAGRCAPPGRELADRLDRPLAHRIAGGQQLTPARSGGTLDAIVVNRPWASQLGAGVPRRFSRRQPFAVQEVGGATAGACGYGRAARSPRDSSVGGLTLTQQARERASCQAPSRCRWRGSFGKPLESVGCGAGWPLRTAASTSSVSDHPRTPRRRTSTPARRRRGPCRSGRGRCTQGGAYWLSLLSPHHGCHAVHGGLDELGGLASRPRNAATPRHRRPELAPGRVGDRCASAMSAAPSPAARVCVQEDAGPGREGSSLSAPASRASRRDGWPGRACLVVPHAWRPSASTASSALVRRDVLAAEASSARLQGGRPGRIALRTSSARPSRTGRGARRGQWRGAIREALATSRRPEPGRDEQCGGDASRWSRGQPDVQRLELLGRAGA